MNKTKRKRKSRSVILFKRSSYTPKNSIIYEKLIAGNTNAAAKGKPTKKININEFCSNICSLVFIMYVINKAIQKPNTALIDFLTVTFLSMHFLVKANKLYSEITQNIMLENLG